MSNSTPNDAQAKALDLIANLPGHKGKVAQRGNAAKGVLSRSMAESLANIGLATLGDNGRTITLAEATPADPEVVIHYPAGKTPAEATIDQDDAPEVDTPVAEPEADKAPAKTKPKTNGRKAAAEKSPYSTAPVAGYVKREGKSRRTGTQTRIVDLLHPKAEHPLKGSGRYRIECVTHKAHTEVPDMTAAKPIQARTDQFCKKCATALAEGDTATA